MAKKKKYYVVWEGNQIGIFDSWANCQAQIKGYPNAKFKSFPSLAAAKLAFDGNYYDHISSTSQKTKPIINTNHPDIIWDSIAVDAACSGNPGLMEYRGVDTKTGMEFFKQGPFQQGTNNVGEFLALVHGLAYLQKQNKPHLSIYSDSKIAMGWVKNKRVNTKLAKTAANKKLFDLIDRGIAWLRTNSYQNPILKWETKEWGEIPADFGRK